jgi:predicted transposase YbfD/YdcC
MEQWRRHFEAVPDPRKAGHAFTYRLSDVLMLALCALLCGAETFVEMEEFGWAKQEWLCERLGLGFEADVPSHDTIGRLFSRLDPQAFGACFEAWTRELHERTQGQVLAVDGKTVRRSFDTATDKAALHLVSVWAQEARLVLAQQDVEARSNEITAVEALLQRLDVRGCVVTVDALNTQKHLAGLIVKKKGDYVMALKENHGLLHQEVRDYFAWLRQDAPRLARAGCDVWEQKEWGHGRREVRRCFCLEATAQDWPCALAQWPGLKSLIVIERERGTPNTPTSRTLHFYLSSLTPHAKEIAQAVRAHWQVENSVHWCLDVALREDESRVRKDHAPRNLATLRRLVLNLMRQDKTAKCGLKARRHKAGWSNGYLLQRLVQA